MRQNNCTIEISPFAPFINHAYSNNIVHYLLNVVNTNVRVRICKTSLFNCKLTSINYIRDTCDDKLQEYRYKKNPQSIELYTTNIYLDRFFSWEKQIVVTIALNPDNHFVQVSLVNISGYRYTIVKTSLQLPRMIKSHLVSKSFIPSIRWSRLKHMDVINHYNCPSPPLSLSEHEIRYIFHSRKGETNRKQGSLNFEWYWK